jgi:hypothetical protein
MFETDLAERRINKLRSETLGSAVWGPSPVGVRDGNLYQVVSVDGLSQGRLPRLQFASGWPCP